MRPFPHRNCQGAVLAASILACVLVAAPPALADPCVPQCDGRACGDDGCGGSCGVCPDDGDCLDGTCVPRGCAASPTGAKGCNDCACEACVCAIDDWCCDVGWDDVCSLICGTQCDGGCPCRPDCTGRACGDDGCGGSCGGCADGAICAPATWTCCVQTCQDRVCGEDGCGDPDGCGRCAPGTRCQDGGCAPCVPDCDGRECGDDSCGGSCGTCVESASCSGGTCVPSRYPDLCLGQGKPSADTCHPSLTGFGCCDGSGRAVWCDKGKLYCVDCPANASPRYQACGWTDTALLTGYDCGFTGEDPAGTNPRVCDFCMPACIGKTCGPDGCGGSCGACADGLECRLGQCEAPAPDVLEPDALGEDAVSDDPGPSDPGLPPDHFSDSPTTSDAPVPDNPGAETTDAPPVTDPGQPGGDGAGVLDNGSESPEDLGGRSRGGCNAGAPGSGLPLALVLLGLAMVRSRRRDAA